MSTDDMKKGILGIIELQERNKRLQSRIAELVMDKVDERVELTTRTEQAEARVKELDGFFQDERNRAHDTAIKLDKAEKENQRLREALEKIATEKVEHSHIGKLMREIAKQALAGGGDGK